MVYFNENITYQSQNSIGNKTADDLDKDEQVYLKVYDFAIPALGFFIIIINCSVVISSGLLVKDGQEPRLAYLFLGNVAMADLLNGISVVFGQLYPISYRNHYICALQIGMIVSGTLASVFSVGLLAMDRFLYIVHGIKYGRWIYPRRAKLLILLVWILAAFIGFLPLMGWYGNTNDGRICWFISVAPQELILLTVLLGVIPISIVLILYSIILYHALKNITHIKMSICSISNTIGSVENLRMFKGKVEQTIPKLSTFKKIQTYSEKLPNKWKAIKIVLFTTLSFLFTWTPYFIACVIYVFCNCEENTSNVSCQKLRLLIASPLAILGFCNSLINPIIYAWWHNGFRNFVKKKLQLCRKANLTQAHFNESINIA